MTAHLPMRPLWICEIDGADWPCSHARDELHEQYAGDLPGLGVYMATRLLEASRELADTPHGTPRLLYERFLFWTRSRARRHV
jgi:hypothetical protein